MATASAKSAPRRGTTPFLEGRRAQLSKGEVNYRLDGPPGAPVVVCIHGLNASLASFETLGAALKERGLQVLTYDMYGFGLSAAPRGRLNPALFVLQLQELLEFVQPTPEGESAARVHIVGYCLGGIVATEFALRHPNRVGRVLLIAPCGLSPRSEAPCQPLLFNCLRRPCRGALLMGTATCLAWCCQVPGRWYLRGKVWDSCVPDVREPEAEHFQEYGRLNTQRVAWALSRSVSSCLRGLRDMPIWREDFSSTYEQLADSQIPVLFMWGGDDQVVPWAEVEEELSRVFGPKGSVSCIHIDGGGHGIILDPADVIKVATCAAAWFNDSNDPNWHQCLLTHALKAPGQEERTPSGALPGAQVVGNNAV